MVDGGDESRCMRSQDVSEVEEVSGIGRHGEQLIDDREEIVQRSDGSQRWHVAGPAGSPGGGEQECGVDGLQGDAAIVQSSREATIGTPHDIASTSG